MIQFVIDVCFSSREMAKKIREESIESLLASIKARFENGTIKRMADLTKIGNTTDLKTILGMGFDTLVSRCAAPEKFIIADLVKLSQIANVDIDLIMKVVLKEAAENVGKIDLKKFIEKDSAK